MADTVTPTEEQVRRFWEWCGFTFRLSASENPHYWVNPEGYPINKLPPLNLNSLFRYAVPQLTKATVSVIPKAKAHAVVCKGDHWKSSSWSPDMEDDDPALALFWAIWAIIEKEKEWN